MDLPLLPIKEMQTGLYSTVLVTRDLYGSWATLEDLESAIWLNPYRLVWDLAYMARLCGASQGLATRTWTRHPRWQRAH